MTFRRPECRAASSRRIRFRLKKIGRCRPLAVTGVCLELGAGAPLVIRSQAMPAFMGMVPGTNVAVTVVEGPGEPRSIGSYALWTCEIQDPDWPRESFAAGPVVREREGTVEALSFGDVDGDKLGT